MNVFEKELPISEKILANSSVFSPVKIKSFRKEEDKETIAVVARILSNLDKDSLDKIFASTKHPYLTYLSAILCSTVINANDDTLISSELWKARKTIINQPFNQEHEEKRIIGHVINSRCIDKDGKVISDTDSPPDYFDVEFDAVIYDSIYPDIVENIIDKASNQEIGVSMECRITDFAYGVLENDKIVVIERNAATSELSKYLRAYGGAGEYNGKRLVRVLKNLTFVGVASTENPANEASLYTKINDNVVQANNLDCINNKNDNENKTEGNEMFTKLEDAIAHINKIEAENTQLKASNEDGIKKISTLEASITTEKEKLVVAEAKITSSQAEIDSLKTSNQKLTDDITKITSERDDFKSQIEKINATKLGNDRVSQLESFNQDFGDKRVEAVERYSKLSQDSFDEILAIAKKHYVKPTQETLISAAIDNAVNNGTSSADTDDKPITIGAAIEKVFASNRLEKPKKKKI